MVSIATLKGASDALEIGGKITGETPQKVKHGGRHWSYGLMVASAVVGAITTVVAGILSQIPFVVAGLLLCITGSISAYYLKSFGILKSLEDYVDHLSATVKKIDGVIGNLRKGNKELKEINKGLDKTIETRGEVLDKSKKKLEMMIKLYENLKKVTFGLTEQVASFSSENELLDENVDELLEYIKQLDINNDKLAGEVDELVEQNDRFDKVNEIFKQLGGKLEDNLSVLKTTFNKQKGEIQALKEAVKKLSALRRDVSQGAKQVQQSQRMYEETNLRLQRLLKQLAALEAVPELIAILKTASKK